MKKSKLCVLNWKKNKAVGLCKVSGELLVQVETDQWVTAATGSSYSIGVEEESC